MWNRRLWLIPWLAVTTVCQPALSFEQVGPRILLDRAEGGDIRQDDGINGLAGVESAASPVIWLSETQSPGLPELPVPSPIEMWISDLHAPSDIMTLGEVWDDPQGVRPVQGQASQPALRPDILFQSRIAPPAGSVDATRETSLLGLTARMGSLSAREDLLSRRRRQRLIGRSADVVSGLEAAIRSTTDAGDLTRKSPATPSVRAPKRNPIVTDTRIRGNAVPEVAASGSYWVPARMDLDTMLSKLDSRTIEDMIVIKGPYSVLYGPGFDFVDVQLLRTQRFQNGAEMHGSTSADYKVNGEQWYGRQTLWGGHQDWGFRVGYGHRTGNDYTAGDGAAIPSSYNSRDLDFAWGADLLPNHHVEFNYLRLDQTGVEYPGQAFDMDFLATDGFEVEYVWEHHPVFDSLTIDGWYNRTRFEGNAQQPGKRRQFPFYDFTDFVGFTDVDSMSAGFRAAGRWGDPDSEQLAAGADLRYIKQELNEITSGRIGFTIWDRVNSPIPRSHLSNPGLFLDYVNPISERSAVAAGARVDWASANIDDDAAKLTDVTTDQRPYADVLGTSDFDRDYFLFAAFVSGQRGLNDNWTAVASGGYAERPPMLTELYAAEPFMFLLQNGLNTVTGDPTLNEERLWQVDVGLRYGDARRRVSINGFHAWVKDKITFENIGEVSGPPLGQVEQTNLRFVNTRLATLAGFEFQGEYDLAPQLTAFSVLSYVEGRDRQRNEPLPSILPLEGLAGLRFHQAAPQPVWSVELSVRMVDNQDRVATSLLESPTPGFAVWNVRSFWRARDSLLLVAGVENLTDRNYREHLAFRPTGAGGLALFDPGVNFYFGTEMRY